MNCWITCISFCLASRLPVERSMISPVLFGLQRCLKRYNTRPLIAKFIIQIFTMRRVWQRYYLQAKTASVENLLRTRHFRLAPSHEKTWLSRTSFTKYRSLICETNHSNLLAHYFLFGNHLCGEEYVRKTFMYVNKQLKHPSRSMQTFAKYRSLTCETMHLDLLAHYFLFGNKSLWASNSYSKEQWKINNRKTMS